MYMYVCVCVCLCVCVYVYMYVCVCMRILKLLLLSDNLVCYESERYECMHLINTYKQTYIHT